MKDDMLNALLVWGDRSNRDTAHLLDIAIAGTIEQTIGHGTVTLRPARLEEIVSRIGPRERDPDGGWKVTLLPDPNVPAGPLPTINIRCETVSDGITGTTSLPVVRVETEDDGSLTAVTDHRPNHAGSPVARDLAARTIAAGNPLENDQVKAAILRELRASTDEDVIERLGSVLGIYFQNMLQLAGTIHRVDN